VQSSTSAKSHDCWEINHSLRGCTVWMCSAGSRGTEWMGMPFPNTANMSMNIGLVFMDLFVVFGNGIGLPLTYSA